MAGWNQLVKQPPDSLLLMLARVEITKRRVDMRPGLEKIN